MQTALDLILSGPSSPSNGGVQGEGETPGGDSQVSSLVPEDRERIVWRGKACIEGTEERCWAQLGDTRVAVEAWNLEGRTLLKVQTGKREQGDGTWRPGRGHHPLGPAWSRKRTGRGPTPAWELGQRRLEDNGCVAMGQEAGGGWCDLGWPWEEPQEGITVGIRRAALGGGSSEQQCVRHAFPSLHLCLRCRPHPPSSSGTSSLSRCWGEACHRPADRCLSPLPPTPGCSRVRSLQGPSPWAALPLRLMGIVPRVRQMLQPLSDCCLPGWSVCAGVVPLLMRLPGPPAPEPAHSSWACPSTMREAPVSVRAGVGSSALFAAMTG